MSYSLAAIFSAGLLTFVSPCILPLVPVYLATIAGGALDERRAGTLARAIAFSLGISSVFVVMGALAATLGTWLNEYRTAITAASAVLMVLFGLRALGVLRLGVLERDTRPVLSRVRTASTWASAFLFGAAFALGWSPCIGPVLASVLTFVAANAGSPAEGAAYLSLYAAGLTAPLLLLAAGADKARVWLKASRAWIPALERTTGVALLLVGAWTGWSALDDGTTPPPPAATAETAPAGTMCVAGPDGHGTCDLPEIVAEGHAGAVKAVSGAHLLEFTSGDCPICQRMRPVVDRIEATCPEVHERFVQVDVTTREGRALAAQHAVRGTPTFVVLGESGVEQARLIGERSTEELHAALEGAWGVACRPGPAG